MKISKFGFPISLAILIIALLLSACNPAAPTAAPTAETTPSPENAEPANPEDAILEAVRQMIILRFGANEDLVNIQSFETREWPDTCLGIQNPGEVCIERATQGYGGKAEVNGIPIEFRTNENGIDIRFIPQAALAARDALLKEPGNDGEEIRFVSIEHNEWPDACLGVSREGEMCAQVMTLGYRVVMLVGSKQYEYRTNIEGSTIIQVPAPEDPALPSDLPLLLWMEEGEDGCKMAAIDPQKISQGLCSSELVPGEFGSEIRMADAVDLFSTFAPFNAQTPTGSLQFNGQGKVTATTSEQRMIAEFAKLAASETEAGFSDPELGLALAWHREGGIAGFCDDVSIYLSGEVIVKNCKSGEENEIARFRLTFRQLESLYNWVDNLRTFELEETEAGEADMLFIRLLFTGIGEKGSGPADQQLMKELSSELALQASLEPNPEDLAAARAALQEFFELLNQGQYSEAVERYGGDYAALTDFNPDISADDAASLLEAGCAVNGYQCLQILNITSEAQVTGDTFRFGVEFQDPGGNVFSRGPCCGADINTSPPETRFEYTVKKVEDKFLVQELPVYLP
ncbi:MAG: hypothetical protein EHM41_17125 [Chloroflexi bacterium]|nr:MAG: hypothetical protein EHM41_17125 [Chloroflexota bacterium]